MSIFADKTKPVGGFDLMTVRKALKIVARHRSEHAFFTLGGLGLDYRECAVLHRELSDLGLFSGDEMHPLSRDGVAIAASIVRHYPIGKADELIEQMLDRIEKYNADPGSLYRINEVWVFGSVLRREPLVGDIDLAISLTINPAFETDDDRLRRIDELSREVPNGHDIFAVMFWHLKKCILGAKAHPLMKGASDLAGLVTLIALAVPCRRIYDIDQGGRVLEPMIEKHPRASSRMDIAADPMTFPSAVSNTSPPRPLDGKWVTGFHFRQTHFHPSLCMRQVAATHEELFRTSIHDPDSEQIPRGCRRKDFDDREADYLCGYGGVAKVRRSMQVAEGRAVIRATCSQIGPGKIDWTYDFLPVTLVLMSGDLMHCRHRLGRPTGYAYILDLDMSAAKDYTRWRWQDFPWREWGPFDFMRGETLTLRLRTPEETVELAAEHLMSDMEQA